MSPAEIVVMLGGLAAIAWVNWCLTLTMAAPWVAVSSVSVVTNSSRLRGIR